MGEKKQGKMGKIERNSLCEGKGAGVREKNIQNFSLKEKKQVGSEKRAPKPLNLRKMSTKEP